MRKKEISIKEFRRELFNFQKRLKELRGKNSLTKKYFHKVDYMITWMRYIPADKVTLDGWHMPDMGVIIKMRAVKKK